MPIVQMAMGSANGTGLFKVSQESVGKQGLSSGLLKPSLAHALPTQKAENPEPSRGCISFRITLLWEKTLKVPQTPNIQLQVGSSSSWAQASRDVVMGGSWVPTAMLSRESQNVRDG